MIKYMLPLFSALLLFSLNANAITEEALTSLAEGYLKSEHNKEAITAIGVSVMTADNQLTSAYAGSNGIYDHKKISNQTLFQVGSITKSFVAAAILKLISQSNGKVSLDDKLIHYFPEYPKWGNVTIRQLLNMTSGIPNYTIYPALINKYAENPYQYYPPTFWLTMIYGAKLSFKPGAQYQYSNTNYLLLGLLIERLSGHSLQETFNTKFFKPLGLKNTFFVEETMPRNLYERLAHGYQFEKPYAPFIPLGTDVTAYNLSCLNAAGSIISNSEDIAKWVHALYNGSVLTPEEFTNLTSLISLRTGKPIQQVSEDDQYGYGLGIGSEYLAKEKKTLYMYNGITFGYRAIYAYDPSEKIAVVITVNSNLYQKPYLLKQFAYKVLALFHNNTETHGSKEI